MSHTWVFLLLTLCEASQYGNSRRYVNALQGKSYRNHALIHSIPNSSEELAFFKTFEYLYNVIFWKKPTEVHNAVEFSISPDNLAELYRNTAQQPLRLTILTRDLQRAFDEQIARPYPNGTMQSFSWNSFYRLHDIYDWLVHLGLTYPNEVRLREIGKSYENRTILAVKLTLQGSITRGKVVIEGGCHGNEWISPAFVTYMLYTLLNAKKYGNEKLQTIATMYSWIFVPVMNPDGYEYAHTTDRLWKKNRRDSHGVDLNRNYGIAFGAYCPDKSNKGNREYCGDSPFSEPESFAMSQYTRKISENVEYYLSFHSFGQHIVLPYSYIEEHKDNYNMVKKKAYRFANRVRSKYGIKYTIGNSYEVEGYMASGTSSDWVKRAFKVPYVATFKLPDAGVHGYALPPDRILPTCQATMDGLLLFLDPDTDIFFRSDCITLDNRIHVISILLCNAVHYFFYRVYFY